MATGQILVAVCGFLAALVGVWLLVHERGSTHPETTDVTTPVGISVSGPVGVPVFLAGLAVLIFPFTPWWPPPDAKGSPAVIATPTITVPPATPTPSPSDAGVLVPNVIGLAENDGVSTLSDSGFQIVVQRGCSSEGVEGQVFAIAQGPISGEAAPLANVTARLVPAGETLTVFVSSGTCEPADCTQLEPSSATEVRFSANSSSGEVVVSLDTGETAEYRLSLGKSQEVDVIAASALDDTTSLICVFDPSNELVGSSDSRQLSTGPLRVSGTYRVLLGKTSGQDDESYRLRFVVPP